MARAKNERNGRLEEAMRNLLQAQADLVQTQAAFVQNQAAFQVQLADINRQIVESNRQREEVDRINSERFVRIEAILRDHTRILQALPETIREKIGFKVPERPAPA
jgi:hypothetical protein